MNPSSPRVRFAPSPTGYLHIGGARSALFNWLYARHFGGTFVLRIEDTDRERSTPESLRAIFEAMKWLKLNWDEGPEVGGGHAPYFQTERLNTYRAVADQLLAEGKAYRCYCTREQLEARRKELEKQKITFKYEGTCRNRTDTPLDVPHVIRFKMPSEPGTVEFKDRVLGTISKEHADLDDWVMMRFDGVPLYNFGCVVDDHLMEITLVGRGQEHVNSTFPQLMLYKALGWTPPEFAHFPLILGQDREKLSKRKHPEADVMLHAKNGILPEALINFVARLGWSHGNDETMTVEQMIQYFDFDHVGSTSGVWNPDKLLWLNQHYLKTLDPKDIAQRLKPFLDAKGFDTSSSEKIEGVVVALRERAKTLQEMADTAAYFFSSGVQIDEKAAAKHLNADGKALLTKVRELIEKVGQWKTEDLDQVIKQVSEQSAVGMGKVAQPVRVAVTGNTFSPGIGQTLELIGKQESLRRLEAALAR